MNTDLKTDVEYHYNSTTNKNSLLSINECKQYKLDTILLFPTTTSITIEILLLKNIDLLEISLKKSLIQDTETKVINHQHSFSVKHIKLN